MKCLAQEHNTMSPASARTRTARSGVEHTKGRTIRNPGRGGRKFPVHEFFFSVKFGCRNFFSHVEGLHEFFFSIFFNYVMLSFGHVLITDVGLLEP